MKKCVVLSGAGISADSGLKTFRDAGGLWEGHRVEDVCTPQAYAKNPQLNILAGIIFVYSVNLQWAEKILRNIL